MIKKNHHFYDCAIIGAGPAGLTAGIYAARYKLKTILITKEFGGTCLSAHQVENYPGFPQISGQELMNKFKEHLLNYPVTTVMKEVKRIEPQSASSSFRVKTAGQDYLSRTVILAPGTIRKKLDVPGEQEFLGKGISYCATCDAIFFKDKVVGVVGGSNAAVTAALLVSQHARKVYLIHRQDQLRAEPVWIERAEKNPKIELIYRTNIRQIKGEQVVKAVVLDKPYQGQTLLPLDGLFIEIGAVPLVGLAHNLGVKINERNMIIINQQGATNVTGVYAAGDATTGFYDLHQVITAAAAGATAATSAYEYLVKNK